MAGTDESPQVLNFDEIPSTSEIPTEAAAAAVAGSDESPQVLHENPSSNEFSSTIERQNTPDVLECAAKDREAISKSGLANGGLDSLEADTVTQSSEANVDCMVDCTQEFTTDKIFSSREELCEWTCSEGRKLGFVIIILTSDAGGPNKKPRVTIGCERSGHPKWKNGKSAKKRKMVYGSKKCGCPFILKGQKRSLHTDGWTLKVICGVHNHSATKCLEGHSYAGRLSASETFLLVDMSKNQVRPRDILTILKEMDPKNVSTMKTVYNARHKHRVHEQSTRLQMQQLLLKVLQFKYIEWHRTCEDTGVVKDLFWAHPVSVHLLHAFPDIIIMDCTRKTNKYDYSMLEIVGVTSTNLTFSVAFAFLESEKEENYAWVLDKLRGLFGEKFQPDVIVSDRELALMNSIERTFPTSRHLLCRWHINKAVFTKCKKMFESESSWQKFISSWNVVVFSNTIDEFTVHMTSLQNEFSSFSEPVRYVTSTWLEPYKERFVALWTDTCRHRDNVISNRADGAHAKLKRQLGTSQGCWERCWTGIHSLIELQQTEVKASFQKSLSIVQQNFMVPEFRELCGVISIYALNMIISEFKRSNSIGVDPVACGCVLRRTHNLPCAHELATYKRDGRSIPLESIDSHWSKLDMSPCLALLDISCAFEIERFKKRFEEANNDEKRQLIMKLREIVNSTTSTFGDPTVKTTGRDKKCRKIGISAQHDTSTFELVGSECDSTPPLVQSTITVKKRAIQKLAPKRISKPKAPQIIPTEQNILKYKNSLPIEFKEYISHIGDVLADGNCGFRVIADCMGLSEDQWPQVRRDLLGELHTNMPLYFNLYGSAERIKELTVILNYFESHPHVNHWMTMPDMGHLIASRYEVVVYLISQQQCLTFLPLRSAPPVSIHQHKVVGIAFLGGCHFVRIFFKTGHPVPPIALNWKKFHFDCATGWATPYADRVKEFKQVIGPNVATQEIIVDP